MTSPCCLLSVFDFYVESLFHQGLPFKISFFNFATMAEGVFFGATIPTYA